MITRIWTDGSVRGNPGPGGWAVLIAYGGDDDIMALANMYSQDMDAVSIKADDGKSAIKIICGGESESVTNIEMELEAVIQAAESLHKDAQAVIYTDCEFIVNAINKGWLHKWKHNGWKKVNGGGVANINRWERYVAASSGKSLMFTLVTGHADKDGGIVSYGNGFVDDVAGAESLRAKESYGDG